MFWEKVVANVLQHLVNEYWNYFARSEFHWNVFALIAFLTLQTALHSNVYGISTKCHFLVKLATTCTYKRSLTARMKVPMLKRCFVFVSQINCPGRILFFSRINPIFTWYFQLVYGVINYTKWSHDFLRNFFFSPSYLPKKVILEKNNKIQPVVIFILYDDMFFLVKK